MAISLSAHHPLDPLDVDELQRACDLLIRSRGLSDQIRFATVQLMEPERGSVLAHPTGTASDRVAFISYFDRGNGDAFEASVNLTTERVELVRHVPIGSESYGHPPVLFEEFALCERVVKADANWRAAVARRGLSEAEIDNAQVDPVSAGNFGTEAEQGRRLVRAVSYYRRTLQDNAYAHPIEGLVALVDLIGERIVQLIDDERAIPIPKVAHNYDTASLPPARTDLKPLHISQPEGPSFQVEGWSVSWQNWRFRLGFTPREGIVLHQLSIQDGLRMRPVVYRASITEMVVPYADPTTNHYWKCAFDAGEYGLGKFANRLELGCDCVGLIRYFDVPAVDDFGRAFEMKQAICMHEEDYGILWKHYEFRTGVMQARRSRRLVISSFATVGNYDYGFYWYLYQDGTLGFEAKLTGIVQTAAVPAGEEYRWGGLVTPELGGPTHQHFFNARLHMMVDGEGNSVTEHEHHPRPFDRDNPYGNAFDTTGRALLREQDAAREADGRTGRFWKIVNPNVLGATGKPTGYKLVVTAAPLMLAQEGSAARRRGGFATKHLWVTRYDADQRHAGGAYPNQHAGGDGLPAYIERNLSIDNEDLVVWHTFGLTHVCKPEDFPVMPVEYVGFHLKPSGFFDGNPALDLPPSAAEAGHAGSAVSACCADEALD